MLDSSGLVEVPGELPVSPISSVSGDGQFSLIPRKLIHGRLNLGNDGKSGAVIKTFGTSGKFPKV